MKKPLGCLSATGIITAVFVLLAIAGFILFGGGTIFSPGPLNAQTGDAALGDAAAHIDLSRQCGACHAPFWGQETMSDRCLVCHPKVAEELQISTSLHSVMMIEARRFCQDCHTEHNGPTAALTIIDTGRFPHAEATGFSLQAHDIMFNEAPFACADCHPDGLNRFDQQACDACHRDIDIAFAQIHAETFGRDCLACHDGIDAYGAAFDHNQLDFPLEGAHALTECAGCHQEMYTLADLQATEQTCYACHQQDDEHRGRFGHNCAVCHTSANWKEAKFDHALTEFPLVGAHNEIEECTACHFNNLFKDTSPECYACHQQDDAHNGEFGQDCAACHTSATWEEATFDHNLTNFPLTGGHERVECEACHLNNVFKGTSQDCYACHQQDDTHNGEFGQDCAVCHIPVNWEEATFDHALTSFSLTGGHEQVECEACHLNNVFKGTPQDCYACHLEPFSHLGMFGTICLDCHTTTAWIPATYNLPHTFPFDHERRGRPWECLDCHPASLLTYSCYEGCHEHTLAKIEGEHREEGVRDFQDCIACHPTGREHEGERGGSRENDDD